MNTRLKKVHSFFSILILPGLICCAFSVPGCRGAALYDRIGDITWDQNTILFNYEYVVDVPSRIQTPGVIQTSPTFALNIYKVSPDRLPSQALAPPELTDPEDVLFLPRALMNYIFENHEVLQPIAGESASKEELRKGFYGSYQAQTQFILLAHSPRTGLPESTVSYSLINTREKTFRDVKYDDKIQSPNVNVIMWTGLGNQVMVQYQKENILYFGVSEINSNTSELEEIKIFKQYETDQAGLFYDYYLTNKNEHKDVKILGFESKNTVYYLEKPAFSQEVLVIKQNLDTGMMQEIGSLDKDSSYYPHLRHYSQVSLANKKVAYSTTADALEKQFIYVSNFDGSNVRLLVSRQRDLPLGKPIPF